MAKTNRHTGAANTKLGDNKAKRSKEEVAPHPDLRLRKRLQSRRGNKSSHRFACWCLQSQGRLDRTDSQTTHPTARLVAQNDQADHCQRCQHKARKTRFDNCTAVRLDKNIAARFARSVATRFVDSAIRFSESCSRAEILTSSPIDNHIAHRSLAVTSPIRLATAVNRTTTPVGCRLMSCQSDRELDSERTALRFRSISLRYAALLLMRAE